MKYPLILVCVGYLLGCSNSPVQTNYPPPATPTPPAIESPFYNGFLGLSCTEDVPPKCVDDGKPWATFDRPGKSGQSCTTPGICYSVIGRELHIDADDPGFPMIRRETVSREHPIAVSMQVTAQCKLGAECYVGPVLFNGEGVLGFTSDGKHIPTDPALGAAYRSLYLDRSGVRVYAPTATKYLMLTIPGHTYLLELVYDNGVWSYYVNGELKLIEIHLTIGTDPLLFHHDPHPAIWAGNVRAVVTGFEVR